MHLRSLIYFTNIALVLTVACAKNSLSDRDSRREQMRNTAESKRRELEQIAGIYNGKLVQTSGIEQVVTLDLQIKDIPQPVEGQVDPVPTPVLTGFLRVILGDSPDEYVGFGIDKAEYDPKRARLDIVCSNDETKDLILSLSVTEGALAGSWTAPKVSTSGTAEFSRQQSAQATGAALQGEYSGVLYREKQKQYQFSALTLRSSFQPPQGLILSATVRIIFGSQDSGEYLTYRFDNVQFNPINGRIVLQGAGLDVAFSGTWNRGKLAGDWTSTYTGRLGVVEFEKGNQPIAKTDFELFESLKGTYQGEIENTHPDSNLPERVLISFVTSQDLSAPNGIGITGSLRLYLGDFGSHEYVEMPLTDIQFNFFTRKLVAKTTGDYKITLKGDADGEKILAKVFTDALGEVGHTEVTKQ